MDAAQSDLLPSAGWFRLDASSQHTGCVETPFDRNCSETLAIEMIETVSRRQDAYPLVASTPGMATDRVQGVEMKQSRVAICPRHDMPNYGQRLANLPLKKLLWAGTSSVRDNWTTGSRNGLLDGCVGDLGPDDHLVIPSCSRAYLANLRGTRCQVSLWLREPPIIHGRFYRTAKWWHKRFKHVLTFDQPLIDRIPNAVFIPHGGCWLNPIPKAEQLAVSKTQGISLIASPKRDTEGHCLRHDVILWASANGNPVDAFGKQYRSLPEKSGALLPYRHSIVIENSQSSNYFTEKLIDCMLCNCLPIYWGTADVKHYFDPSGILFCESFEEICDTIATLAPDDYQNRLAAIQRNREIALSYSSAERIIFETLGQPTYPTSVAYHRVSNGTASQPAFTVRVP